MRAAFFCHDFISKSAVAISSPGALCHWIFLPLCSGEDQGWWQTRWPSHHWHASAMSQCPSHAGTPSAMASCTSSLLPTATVLRGLVGVGGHSQQDRLSHILVTSSLPLLVPPWPGSSWRRELLGHLFERSGV